MCQQQLRPRSLSITSLSLTRINLFTQVISFLAASVEGVVAPRRPSTGRKQIVLGFVTGFQRGVAHRLASDERGLFREVKLT